MKTGHAVAVELHIEGENSEACVTAPRDDQLVFIRSSVPICLQNSTAVIGRTVTGLLCGLAAVSASGRAEKPAFMAIVAGSRWALTGKVVVKRAGAKTSMMYLPSGRQLCGSCGDSRPASISERPIGWARGPGCGGVELTTPSRRTKRWVNRQLDDNMGTGMAVVGLPKPAHLAANFLVPGLKKKCRKQAGRDLRDFPWSH